MTPIDYILLGIVIVFYLGIWVSGYIVNTSVRENLEDLGG